MMTRLVWFELVKTFTRWRTYIGFIAFGLIVPLDRGGAQDGRTALLRAPPARPAPERLHHRRERPQRLVFRLFLHGCPLGAHPDRSDHCRRGPDRRGGKRRHLPVPPDARRIPDADHHGQVHRHPDLYRGDGPVHRRPDPRPFLVGLRKRRPADRPPGDPRDSRRGAAFPLPDGVWPGDPGDVRRLQRSAFSSRP